MSDLIVVLLMILLTISAYGVGVWIERYRRGEEDDGRPF